MKRIKVILKVVGIWIVSIFLIYCAIFWTSQFWFTNSYKKGNYTFYGDSSIKDVDAFISVIDRRLKACPIYDSTITHNVYICESERLFKFYAWIANSSYPAQGFNKHIFNKIYISKTFINEVRADRVAANEVVPHSAMEGSLEAVICHEIVHSFVRNKLGGEKADYLPTWKQEGYAEYGANIFSKANDKTYNFTQRLELYRDNSFWGTNRAVFEYYEGEILMEFLLDIEKMTFCEVMDETFTYEMALERLAASGL